MPKEDEKKYNPEEKLLKVPFTVIDDLKIKNYQKQVHFKIILKIVH